MVTNGSQIGLLRLTKMVKMAGNILLISMQFLRKEEHFFIRSGEENGLGILYDIYLFYLFQSKYLRLIKILILVGFQKL